MVILIEQNVLLLLVELCESQTKTNIKVQHISRTRKLSINYSIQILYSDHPPTHIINVLILIITTPLSHFNIFTELKMELLRKLFKPIHTPTLLVAAPALLQFVFFLWPIKKKKNRTKDWKTEKTNRNANREYIKLILELSSKLACWY